MLPTDHDGYLKTGPSWLVMTGTLLVALLLMLLLFAVFIWFLPDDPSLPIQVGAAAAAPLVY